MTKTPSQIEKEFIETSKEITGRSLDEWLLTAKNSGLEKKSELLEWLKSNFNLNHLQSQLVTGIYFNSGKAVYSDELNLLDMHFLKCEQMKPLFDKVSHQILSNFENSQLIPKKTYLSFTAHKEFAALNIKVAELRLGLDLGEYQFNEIVHKSKLTGPMPRISHMLILRSDDDISIHMMDLLRLSFNRNKK